jgi:hypothetical protein
MGVGMRVQAVSSSWIVREEVATVHRAAAFRGVASRPSGGTALRMGVAFDAWIGVRISAKP